MRGQFVLSSTCGVKRGLSDHKDVSAPRPVAQKKRRLRRGEFEEEQVVRPKGKGRHVKEDSLHSRIGGGTKVVQKEAGEQVHPTPRRTVVRYVSVASEVLVMGSADSSKAGIPRNKVPKEAGQW